MGKIRKVLSAGLRYFFDLFRFYLKTVRIPLSEQIVHYDELYNKTSSFIQVNPALIKTRPPGLKGNGSQNQF